MSTPRLPNQKTQYKKLNERLSKYMASVLSIYESLSKEAAGIALTTDYYGESEFSFKDYPITRDRIQKLQQQFVSDLGGLIYAGTSDEWKRSNLLQDMIADKVLGKYVGEHKGKKYEHYYQKNSGALKAFQQRKDRGLNLSDKLWNQSKDLKTSLEETLSVSIEKGIDAVTLSKRISKYLWDFPSMQAAYEEKFGHASKAKDCEYRSIRLARSEINMAYRTAEQERWRQFDFVVGYEIKLSGSHPAEDVCDRLAGKYPKDFVWSGWHPNCYTDEAKVLTADGWKYFRDVKDTDLIFSLNPQTRDVEWTSIVARQCYQYNGEVVRFYNKSLECVVTPDHNMVYIHKYGKDIRKISAKDFRMTLGAFYRTCEHNEEKERDTINIGGEIWNFDDYCEFMGYWLADGSVAHTSTITLCQKCGEPAWDSIISCINRLGYKSFIKKDRIEFNRAPIVRYLRQFGRCNEKYIPTEILSASKRQILLFLNAFIKCDGYSRKTKDYIGSRGSLFHSEKEERLYFTTSDKMAGQLCQLLLMIGHRPSFSIKEPKTHVTQDGKVFNANYPCYVINECYSGTSTVFNKDSVPYNGNVYDLTLEKNHIMYISYNGRCFWGSNCMDYCVPILKTEEEYFADDDIKSKNEVTDVPREFKDWCTENWNRISKAEKRGTLPYFLRDNKEYYQKELSVKKAAVLRHKNRDAKAIQASWDNRTYLRSYAFSEKSLYSYEDYIDVVKQGKYFGVSTKELEEYVLFAKDIKAEEYAKLIESANERIREKHQTVAKYRSELYRIKRSLSEANGQYQMQDIQDKITEFIENNKLAGGPGSIRYGDTMPNASIFREFANKIKKEVVSRSEHLQIKTGISKNLPSVLYPKSKYLKGEDYLFDKEFFDLLPEEVKFEIKDGDGVSHYNSASKICTIYDGNRNAGSRYHAKSVIYHEGGHAIFDRRQLVKDKKFIQLFQYAESELLYMDEFSIYYPLLGGRVKRKMTRGSYISRRLEIISDRVANASDSELKILQRHGFCREDILEAIGSCADLLKSVDNRIGWGHDTSYFSIGDNRQHEFIAHAFELKFIGNPFIKKFMPDIYSRMLAYVESL